MHIAMIMDDERLLHERAMLDRLAIGLIDEGVQLTRVVPDTDALAEEEGRLGLARRIEMPLRTPFWLRRGRTRAIAERFDRSLPDALYVVGQRAWPPAQHLGRLIERPLVLDVWNDRMIRHLHGRRTSGLGGCSAATRPLAKAAARRVGDDLVQYVPFGVSIPESPRAVLSRETIGIMVLGSCRDVPAYQTVLTALSRVLLEVAGVEIFLELNGPREHEIWRAARRLEMLGRMSAISDAALHRPLVTRCDLMVLPETFGRMRSILLEAMGGGVPILSRPSPMLDMLKPDETALIVRASNADAWTTALRTAIADRDQMRSLGLEARRYVQQEHPSSRQVTALLGMLEGVVHGGALAFSDR